MINEAELDLRSRLAAIEGMLGQITALVYERSGLTLADVDRAHEAQMLNLRNQSLVVTSDPALSDVGSDAICAHVERLHSGIRKIAAAVLKPGS